MDDPILFCLARPLSGPTLNRDRPLNTERWHQIKNLLEELDQVPDGERAHWLAERCEGDHELRQEVTSFLLHEQDLEGFIEDPILPLATKDHPARRAIGPYDIVEVLGRGGMGTVYLAERRDEFEQRVALKQMERALDEDLLQRFQAERQILARLEHPNIARLLDGGTTEDGRPYFAMEYVEGLPIDRSCDQHRLDLRQRLRLILEVCSALEIAHRNLVVHRDIKPGNILVDSQGVPKLLDFGIAKRLTPDPEQDPEAPLTAPGRQPLTLQYASPEQVLQLPISTASDIYSLGVLSFRLLTGSLPYRSRPKTLAEAIQRVADEEPIRPSLRPGLDEDPTAIAALRATDPKGLRRHLRGDLDSILLKTLHKAPEERYGSVGRFAEDLERHLEGLPVSARDGTLLYRSGRFFSRHRWALAAALGALLMVIGFTAALFRQLQETARERDRAERVSVFLEDLFQASHPDRSRGTDPTATELLDRGRRALGAGLSENPETRLTLLNTLARTYGSLGRYEEARDLLREAVDLGREFQSGSKLASAINDLAVAHYWLREFDEAEALYREALELRKKEGNPANLIKPLNNLASILLSRGEWKEAETLYRRGLELRLDRWPADHPNVATSLRSLAMVLLARGELAEARPLLERALEIRRQAQDPKSTGVAAVLVSLGRLFHAEGQLEEAEQALTEALTIRLERLGADHPHVGLTQRDLAAVLLDRGEIPTAGVLLQQALRTLHRHRQPGDWDLAELEGVLGTYLLATGAEEEARVCLEESLRRLVEVRGDSLYSRRAARRLGALE